MDILSAIFLGALQGITEWLPVSSSAHLALAQHYFGIAAPIAFDIMLHFGTLIAVIAYFRNDIAKIMERRDARYLCLLAAALVPTAIIGFAFRGFFEAMFSEPAMIAVALLITAAFLLISEKLSRDNKKLGIISAFMVGIAQGISVAPGISRSGATIGAGMLLGVKKEDAAKFSFILAIPAILGASALEGIKAFSFVGIGMAEVLLGTATAAIVGYFSIGLLLDFLKKGRLYVFSAYCALLALAVLALG
ncbi:undecaprenyl-diphosphatase [Candidatus Micrarchaeota archaeon CG08_land_8_20_14_0_20_59_11]|nr:MAG: undecaprenyl-diphosphatase [Candidatus Micrarchaeota archaeon CG08_land_8_20_14_0_20_59_11]